MSNADRNLSRREFVAVVALAAVWRGRVAPWEDDVTIVQFSDAGIRTGVVHVPKVVKPEGEWRKQLSPLEVAVLHESTGL